MKRIIQRYTASKPPKARKILIPATQGTTGAPGNAAITRPGAEVFPEIAEYSGNTAVVALVRQRAVVFVFLLRNFKSQVMIIGRNGHIAKLPAQHAPSRLVRVLHSWNTTGLVFHPCVRVGRPADAIMGG